MLTLKIESRELFNDENQEFFWTEPCTLMLEHSLISLSKWESKHQVPFLSTADKTARQTMDYIECMILNPDFPPGVIGLLSPEDFEKINAYIESPESATTFGKMPKTPGKGETITAELIYYWMVAFTIPFECERWHLNRLFALIRICNIKQQKPKKMSRQELSRQYHDLNERRKRELGTSG